jgi:hypothetical protein
MEERRRTNHENMNADGMQRCRVISEYRSAYPEPFVVRPGEELAISERESEWSGWLWCTNRRGQSRWVPEAYVLRQGKMCIVLRDYDATELTVHVGEELIMGQVVSGWIWCTNQEGQSGWVPAEHLMCEFGSG